MIYRYLAALLCTCLTFAAQAQYYQYDDSAAVAAAYPWINLASPAGTGLALADDQVSGAINLGFTFNFGGTNYTQVRVVSNGTLQFSGTNAAYNNAALPLNGTSGKPNIDFVMLPMWDDFHTNSDPNLIRYRTQGNAPNRVFVVSWMGAPYYCGNRNGTGCNNRNQTTLTSATFQIQIYEQGSFVYRYGVTDGSGGAHTAGPSYSNNGATVGVEVGNTDYVQYSFNTAAVPNGRTILWTARPTVVVPGGFNAFETSTASGAISGVIKTRISGAASTFAVVALNPTRTAVQTGFMGDVKIELLDSRDDSGALNAATGCRTTWAPIGGFSPITLTFAAADAGRKNVTLTENNAWKNVRLRMTYPATGAASAEGCSSDNFAIRPAAFNNFSVTDNDWQTSGSARVLNNTGLSGGTVHKAGRPFSVQATAVNAAGVPVATTNYIDTPNTSVSVCVGTACTSGFGVLAVSTAAVAGVINAPGSTYSEVGSFALQLVDAAFANVDTADSSAVERTITSPVINVGRFVPDHFSVDFSAGNAPALTNRSDIGAGTGCTPASNFTYMDESFGLRYRIEARTYSAVINADGTTGTRTQNYTGAWAQGVVALQAENNDAGIDLASRISNTNGSWANGMYQVNVSNAQFARNAVPDGPYDNLQLGVSVTDADGPVLEKRDLNPLTAGDCIAAANCSGVLLSTTRMRFGRMRLANAYGSELLALPLALKVQYWNGTNFIDHSNDQCTRLNASDVALTFSPPSASNALSACETSVSLSSLAVGAVFNNYLLQLTKPGAGNFGWVDVRVNLGATASGATCVGGLGVSQTAANQAYLRGNWGGGNYDKDPTARARFGTFRSDTGVLYLRENF